MCWFGRMYHIPKKSLYARCLALGLLCNSLCGLSQKILKSPGLYELDRPSQTRRQRCHCWELQDEPFAFFGWIGTACVDLQQGLQLAFDRFSDACDQAGTKISTEKIEVLCLLRHPRQCFLQVSCSWWSRSSTLGWHSRVTEVGTKGLIHGLVKQTQFCVSFIAPWWRNVRFQRTQGFQFLNGFSFRSSPVVMNLRWRLKEYCQKNKRQRWDICEEFSVSHFVKKSTGLKSVKPRMSSYFSESRDPTYISSAMCPTCPSKEWRTMSFRLQSTPTGKRSKLCPRKRWRDYISDFAWSRLGVKTAELSEVVVDRVMVFRVVLGLLPPRLSPKEKRARKWGNEWVCRDLHWTFLFMKLSFVCLPKVNVVFK